ncbi:MAG: ABC transporter substrate-binding protein, partial [Oscillospiraceae bacterium]|nr:ABC transporter substrate-binding protein [Oscillospiraceae bacterium]
MKLKKCILLLLVLCLLLPTVGCAGKDASDGSAPKVGDLKYESTVPLEYANQFAIYKYEGGYSFIDMVDSDRVLVVPEGKPVPENLDSDIVVVQQPLSDIYLVSTSCMALFDALDAFDSISFVGTQRWYIENAEQAMKDGRFIYAGKYNTPDYEMLIHQGCQLAIESTMILHNPEVKEKMLELGIKTIVERSSYENHPLGRTEWIKLYGALLGLEEEAAAYFDEEVGKITALESLESTGKTVAFFHVSTNGNVVTYKT